MKKYQNLPKKNIHSNNSSVKPLPEHYKTSDNNHLTEITIQDQTQTEVTTQVTIGIAHT